MRPERFARTVAVCALWPFRLFGTQGRSTRAYPDVTDAGPYPLYTSDCMYSRTLVASSVAVVVAVAVAAAVTVV